MVQFVVIEYPQNTWSGGLGDRVVGLMSAIMLAHFLNAKLLIKWDSPSIHGVIDLGSFNYYLSRPSLQSSSNVFQLFSIDDRFKYHAILSKQPLSFFAPYRVIHMKCNQELGMFMYQNTNWASRRHAEGYQTHMIELYQSIFKKYLRPIVTHTVIPESPYLAIQLRTGDAHMGVGNHRPVTQVESTVEFLSQHVRIKHPNVKKIYCSSDHPSVANWLQRNLPHVSVTSNPQSRVHLDRAKVNDCQLKALLLDMMTLMRADYLIISTYSNFGRMAALMSKHVNSKESNEKLFGFDVSPSHKISPVVLSRLFSKHDSVPLKISKHVLMSRHPQQQANVRMLAIGKQNQNNYKSKQLSIPSSSRPSPPRPSPPRKQPSSSLIFRSRPRKLSSLVHLSRVGFGTVKKQTMRPWAKHYLRRTAFGRRPIFVRKLVRHK